MDGHGDDGDLRIGDRERQEALAALATHHEAGRLDAFEYEDRRGRASDAVTRRQLAELFTDLPEPRPSSGTALTAHGPGGAATPVAGAPLPHQGSGSVSRNARIARALAAASPFIAVAAFFLTRTWLVFLLVPVLAVIAKAFEDD